MVARGEGYRGLGEKGEGVEKLQNSHGDTKYSIENTVNNSMITMCGARWALEISGEHFMKYVII